MAVTAGYLAKLRYAVRRNTSTNVDAELADIIEECRLDLSTTGVTAAKAADEADVLVLGAVRCYVRWKFGLSNEDMEANRNDYMRLKDELAKKRDYIGYAITFVCKDGATAKADAAVTFNGETKYTNSAGTAVFYYVALGTNQSYAVSLQGYATQTADVDVSATAAVNVALVAV